MSNRCIFPLPVGLTDGLCRLLAETNHHPFITHGVNGSLKLHFQLWCSADLAWVTISSGLNLLFC